MKWLFRSFATALVISSSCFVFTENALAKIKLTTGTPTKSGKIIARVTFTNGDYTQVAIDVILGTTDIGKAKLLEAAFNNPPINPGPPPRGQRRPLFERTGNMLVFDKQVKIFEKLFDDTGETTTLQAIEKQKALDTQIDGKFIELASTLSGLDSRGNESTFVASLGFKTPTESVFASSNLLFSQLGGNDIDNWLSTIFTDLQGQLPVAYQPNLSLDLSSDEISFVFPDNILLGTGLVSNGTTDTNASSSAAIKAVEAVPESTSTLSLLALGTLGAASTLKRKLKPSQSTEKETTKVS